MSNLVSNNGSSTSTETVTDLVPDDGGIGTCGGVLETGGKCNYACQAGYTMIPGGSALLCTDGKYTFEV
jgi:hypothetical protein